MLVNALKNIKYIHIVETLILKSADEIIPMHDKFVEDGYEGLMIRLDKPYQNKRSRYLLKYKCFDTEEFTILGIEAGRGNKATMAAFMRFRTKDRKPFRAGINSDETECREFLNNKEDYIGKLATVKYFRYTPDNIPRFPKVIAVRDYE